MNFFVVRNFLPAHIKILSTVVHECFKAICRIELNPELRAVEYALSPYHFTAHSDSHYSPRYAKLNISMEKVYGPVHYKHFIAFLEAVRRLD